MNKLSEQIGLRLRIARRAANYRSARSFAFKHNIPESTYSQHETGKRALNSEVLVRYSKLLNIDIGWLLTGEGAICPHQIKDELISSEMQNLKNYLDGSINTIPPIKDRIALVDMDLFFDILRAIAVTFSNDKIRVGYEELLEFCIKVYNNVVSSAANEKSRKAFIEFSISSLKHGINKKK